MLLIHSPMKTVVEIRSRLDGATVFAHPFNLPQLVTIFYGDV